MKTYFYSICKQAKNDVNALQEMKDFVQLAKLGDEDFIMEIVETCKPFVKRFAYQFSKSCNISTYEDLVSYGNLGVLNAINKYDLNSNVTFTTYAFQQIHGAITQNTRKEFTTCDKRPLSISNFNQDEDVPYSVNEETIESDVNVYDDVLKTLNNEQLYEAINELSTKHKEIIVLKYFEGLQQNEIAEHLKISNQTVNSRLQYARKKLREIMFSNGFEL